MYVSQVKWSDLDRTFDLLDGMRRHMDRLWEDAGGDAAGGLARASQLSSATWPRVDIFDAGAELLVVADIPGLEEKALDITLHDGVLTLSGERRTSAPEGYVTHRSERGSARFKRSFALPVAVDGERTVATVKDGVLEVKLAKADDVKARRITVRAQS